MMETFEFTIIATGLDPQADDFEARFYDGGCDDAIVAFQKGHILIDFARESESLEMAIATAVENVRAVGATVERVEPDPLVSLSDMASRAEMSRGAMTNYFKGHRGDGFPAPVARVTSDSPLWDWADVSIWLFKRGRVGREKAVQAVVVTAANDLLKCHSDDFTHSLHDDVEAELQALAL